ncbi:MAG: tRNA (N6-isopentenyl adenosine(37)-C2)-methylthiotransferase MiaB [Polyangiales bacterium]
MSPRYRIETFGCQMNVHDSQRMEDALRAAGWVACEEERDADLIVFNTCSVREKAEHKLRSEVGRLKPLKKERPGVVIAVAGCVAQQEGEKLLGALPHVDVIVGPDNLGELPLLAEAVRMGGPPIARTVFDVDHPSFLGSSPEKARGVTAFVTTMKGCDERCSFCVVPYTRGPERYRPLAEIVEEVRALVSAGTREVTLLGQTVNSWIPPELFDASESSQGDAPSMRTSQSQFARLLSTIEREVPELGRLRYTSPHPRHLTDDLIEAHASLSKLARHVHLPVQSGSNRMLKRMIRRYTRESYLSRVEALRARVPGITLSSDAIVGFPGETEADFEETLSLVREAGFISLFGFKFSPRPHTPALKLADDVPEAEKDARLAALFAAVETQQRAHLASLVGSRVRVLVEGLSKPSQSAAAKVAQRVMGRTERNEIVHLDVPEERDPSGLIGRFLDVPVIRANAHSLVGELDATVAHALPGRSRETVRRSLSVVS